MYFFYIKETGTSDPEIIANKKNGSSSNNEKDHLYVLTALCLHEFHWKTFEIEVSKVKFQLLSQLFREKKLALKLTDCEVKSTWMRIPQERKRKSPFLSALSDDDLMRLSEAFYSEFDRDRMTLINILFPLHVKERYAWKLQLHENEGFVNPHARRIYVRF